MAGWEDYLIQEKERFIDELTEFLRFPSISALPAHMPDVERAAKWLEARMNAAGIESVRVLPTGAHPVVYGDWLHAPGKPTLLIYGHFDTQPVDPLNLWAHPPFEPVIENGRIYARGSTDDKGNLFIPILVVEAMLKTSGKLPLNLKFLFEGQEEIGSPQLPDFIIAHKDLLSCDMVVSADGGQWDEDHPAVVLGTRGLAAVFIDVQGPDHDLHSGTYGGTIANPLHALVQILNSMHDANGRITVAGFYDDVRPLSEEERAQLAKVPFAEAEYLWEIGSSSIFGEPGFTTHERAWARPTLEINGLYGGFQGEGTKTVLPSEAHAKISCRLVADQDPFKIADLLIQHIHKVSPPGVKVTAHKPRSGATPYLIPPDHPGLKVAASVLKDLYGKEPYRIRMGGTIPANALFLQLLRAYTLVFAFGLQDELQHSPNEFFRLSSYERGQKAYGMLFERLGERAGNVGRRPRDSAQG
jgi:acetylornithine deacetylase/succinyl-diaminopimelate desuccinylase-like protein